MCICIFKGMYMQRFRTFLDREWLCSSSCAKQQVTNRGCLGKMSTISGWKRRHLSHSGWTLRTNGWLGWRERNLFTLMKTFDLRERLLPQRTIVEWAEEVLIVELRYINLYVPTDLKNLVEVVYSDVDWIYILLNLHPNFKNVTFLTYLSFFFFADHTS